jgi:hypothetical protein
MKTRHIVAAAAIAIIAYAMSGCAPSPENAALAREAAYLALSEYQRQHPAPPPVRAEK